MKNILRIAPLAAIAIGIVVAVAGEARSQDWGYGPVVVFDQRDGRGTASSFNVGEFRNNRGEFGSLRNDSASSVEIFRSPHASNRTDPMSGRTWAGSARNQAL